MVGQGLADFSNHELGHVGAGLYLISSFFLPLQTLICKAENPPWDLHAAETGQLPGEGAGIALLQVFSTCLSQINLWATETDQ